MFKKVHTTSSVSFLNSYMYSPKTTSLFHCDVNFGWIGKESYGGGGGGGHTGLWSIGR